MQGFCRADYLGVEHGHQARTAHQQTVDAVRAVARRRGDAAWRLIGLTLRLQVSSVRPALVDFIGSRGLDGFSEAEALDLYEEAFPADRKAARSERLRQRQLELLRRLQHLNAETPLTSDLIAGWFEEVTAGKLTAAGIVSLGELNARIAAGGAWYRALPAIGAAKAERIASHLATLLPREARPLKPLFALSESASLFAAPFPSGSLDLATAPLPALPALPAGAGDAAKALLNAKNDLEAVESLDPREKRLGSHGQGLFARSQAPFAVAAVRVPGRCAHSDDGE